MYTLGKQIAMFLESKNEDVSYFGDLLWVSSLRFLKDITSHLNDLNLQIQGKKTVVK